MILSPRNGIGGEAEAVRAQQRPFMNYVVTSLYRVRQKEHPDLGGS